MTNSTTTIEPVILRQKMRWLPADTETPISVYLKLVGDAPGILLESAEVDGRWGRYSILACDMLCCLACNDGALHINVLDPELKSLEKLNGQPFMDGMREFCRALRIRPEENGHSQPPITRALYGYLGFGMASIFNPHLQSVMPADEAECCIALPATVLVFDHLYNRLCQLSLKEHRQIPVNISPSEPDDGASADLTRLEAIPGEEGYKRFAREIREQLRRGEAIQIVPSCRFSAPFAGNPFTIYRRMRRLNASPYMFYMSFPQVTLFGSSPEVMVRCTANSLQLSPIAGTIRRGRNQDEDQALAAELLANPKERAEHVMLVDLGRNDLGRLAKPGTVRVARYMEIERFSHVMHITSDITARLDVDRSLDALDVLAATFPAGTVSGAPKMRAMEIIRKLEPGPRDVYAGCIGWIGLDRDSVNLDMGITIRSMWAKDGRIYWQTGGGIVHDSEPEQEWNEIWNKSAIMRLALTQEGDEYVPVDR